AGGQAGLIVNKQGANDIFTASLSGTARFTITNSGVIKLGANEGVSNQCLLSGGAGIAASWGACGASASNWDVSNGVIRPKFSSTLDLLIGGTATNSSTANFAKFAVLNVNPGAGTPTASIS